MATIDDLIHNLKDMNDRRRLSSANFIIITTSEIGLNKLLIDSQSFSIAEMTNKIIEKHPSIVPFIFNIQMPFPKN